MSEEPIQTPPEAGAGAGAEKMSEEKRAVWRRGLWMLVLLVLFYVAQTVVVITAVLQFGWLLIAGERNPHLAAFGEKLAEWMARTVRFEAAASEDKPFPWASLD